ncbi:MAG TPA: outer membrane beta-barrel protein [Opitutaceae bacterium]
MRRCSPPCTAAAVAALFLAATSPAPALVRMNDGKDQLFVNASLTAAWDSNIFASAEGDGDFITTYGLSLDYQRRAGLIGVNATAAFDVGRFDEFNGEDFANPNLRLELTKDAGRTTGSFTLGAQRESRADSAVNIRTESWNYDAALNLKYPVIERYSLSGNVGYGLRDYQDNSFLVDLETYSTAMDLFYVYTSQRDLLGGYRLRVSETSADTTFYDHAFTLGLSGKILPKLNGTIRGGYQFREAQGGLSDAYQSWTSAVSATWSVNKRLTVTGQLSKDFSTTASNTSVDTFTGNVEAQYAFSAKTSVTASVGGGINEFLGELGAGREDTFFTYNVAFNYTMNERFRCSLGYTYFHNWSTLSTSDFERHSVSLNVTSRF